MRSLLLTVVLLLIGYAAWRLHPRILNDEELRTDRFTVTIMPVTAKKDDTIIVFYRRKP
jgi:hypothetical protein